jgi:hypothetical protein
MGRLEVGGREKGSAVRQDEGEPLFNLASQWFSGSE